MINLCLESTSLLENFKGGSIMSSVEKVSNVVDDKKEAVVANAIVREEIIDKV